MALRIHPVSAAMWARLAATRSVEAGERASIDLIDQEKDVDDPGRRIRAEHARVQARVDALAPQRAAR